MGRIALALQTSLLIHGMTVAPPSAIVEAIEATGRDAILRGTGVSNSRCRTSFPPMSVESRPRCQNSVFAGGMSGLEGSTLRLWLRAFADLLVSPSNLQVQQSVYWKHITIPTMI